MKMRGFRSFSFILITLVTASIVECHYDHWFHNHHKDSTTKEPSLISTIGQGSHGVSESLQNSDDIIINDRVTVTDNGMESVGLGAGIIAAIVIGCIIGVCCLCYCIVRCCSMMCSDERRGAVIVMNNNAHQQPPPPQVIVQQVPVAFQPHPAQTYTEQVNPMLQHYPSQQMQHGQYLQQSAPVNEMQKFKPTPEMYEQSQHSPAGGNYGNMQPAMMPPPYE